MSQTNRLVAEANRIDEFSQWNATAHFEAAGWARWVQIVGGLLPIVLGGFGSWQYLADPAVANPRALVIGSLLSLAAGILGSTLAYLNLTKIQAEHFAAATKYKTLENEARRAHEIHAHSDDGIRFQERVLELAGRYDALNEESAQSWNFALWMARKKIRKGTFEGERNTPT